MSNSNNWDNPNIDDLIDDEREDKLFDKIDKIYKIRTLFDDTIENINEKLTQKEISDIFNIIKRLF